MKWCAIVEFKNNEKRLLKFNDIYELINFVEKHEIRHLRAELC